MRHSKRNMMLKIAVRLSGRSGDLAIEFAVLDSLPRLRDPSGVVESDGTIDLRLVPLNPKYNRAVDMVFELSGSVSIDGTNYEPVFASPANRGFRIKRKRFAAMRIFRASFPRGSQFRTRSTITVTNSNDDGMVWDYGLAFVVPALPRWIGQYDPQIINR